MTILEKLAATFGINPAAAIPEQPLQPAAMPFHHSIELKLKLISLGYEMSQIHRWERRLKASRKRHPELEDKFWSLRGHRQDLKPEFRSTHLAYGFLKGKPYKTMENRRYSNPDWEQVLRMAGAYGPQIDGRALAQAFEQWKQSAGDPDVRQKKTKKPHVKGTKASPHPASQVGG